MTGTGTQADPYIVTTYRGLKAAAENSGAYVAFPDGGGSIDLNNEYPEGVPPITVNCAEINGSGWELKNIHASGITVFNHTNSGAAAFRNIRISDVYLSAGAYLFNVGNNSYDSNILMENVVASGELYDSTFMRVIYCYPKLSSVAMTLHFSGDSGFMSEAANQVTVKNGHLILSGSSTKQMITGGQYINCLVEGSLRAEAAQTLSLGDVTNSSVFDLALEGFTSVQYNGTYTNVINTDKTGAAAVSSSLIKATADQLHDAQWLHESGFPIGVK